MSRLRQRRQAELDRYDLGGAYREIAEELEEVLAEERDRASRSWQTRLGLRVTSGASR